MPPPDEDRKSRLDDVYRQIEADQSAAEHQARRFWRVIFLELGWIVLLMAGSIVRELGLGGLGTPAWLTAADMSAVAAGLMVPLTLLAWWLTLHVRPDQENDR